MSSPSELDPSGRQPGRVGLVLAGGGARGAYEAGALSVLLPELAAAGYDVSVIVGTSVGALNGSWLAANLHRPLTDVVRDHGEMWRELEWEQVLARLATGRSLRPVARYVAGAVFGGLRVMSLLDSAPLEATLRERLEVGQLQANVESGRLRAAAVVATSANSGRSVVFHSGGGRIHRDEFRGIDYAPVPLGLEHVRASAAIPCAFHAVHVGAPEDHAGWYVDGGTRLNTPIKPALALGADRVIVIGLNSTAAPRGRDEERCPDVFAGLGHLTQAVLADPLVHDVRTLATINKLAEGRADRGHRVVPYMFIAPQTRNRLGELAMHVFREHYGGFRGLRTSVGVFGRAVRAGEATANGELLSYLFFAPEYAAALLAEGAADAADWLSAGHDDGIWQIGAIRRRPAAVATT